MYGWLPIHLFFQQLKRIFLVNTKSNAFKYYNLIHNSFNLAPSLPLIFFEIFISFSLSIFLLFSRSEKRKGFFLSICQCFKEMTEIIYYKKPDHHIILLFYHRKFSGVFDVYIHTRSIYVCFSTSGKYIECAVSLFDVQKFRVLRKELGKIFYVKVVGFFFIFLCRKISFSI